MSWTRENGIDTLTTAVECGFGWFVFENIVYGGEVDGVVAVDVYGAEDCTDPLTPYFRYSDDGWCAITGLNPDAKPFHVTSGMMRKARDIVIGRRGANPTVAIRSDLEEQVRSCGDDYDIDADAADCMLQALIFGRLVYS